MLYEIAEMSEQDAYESLNPYYNGICSMSNNNNNIVFSYEVLILIIMEYALWAGSGDGYGVKEYSLNPYYNGICSMRAMKRRLRQSAQSLNPYYNGICSMSSWICSEMRWRLRRLNPYYNGICSMRTTLKNVKKGDFLS